MTVETGNESKIKILSWNVNGLRAVLRRKFGNLSTLLNQLNADVICFQETKLTKGDFDRSLAILEGWDSYFSINRGGSAYSGTATFVRDSSAVVLAAQEGVTGCLHTESSDLDARDLHETGAIASAADTWQHYSQEELELIDNEGRCVVTDHGEFVLFNVYGPAISSEENAEKRFAFKMQFYKALEVRIEALRAKGRRVILLGDLNISPAPLDSCEPGPEFSAREDRIWLNSYLSNGAIDVFRSAHPDRKDAYTCWSQASGARVNNWGARIDLIIAIEPQASNKDLEGELAEQFVSADIWPELQGSDHCPVWADMKVQKNVLMTKTIRPPALSTKNLFTGRQNKITGWLQSRPSQGASSQHQEDQQNSASQIETCSFPSSMPAQKGDCISRTKGPISRSVSRSMPGVKGRGGITKKSNKAKGPVQSSLKLFMKRSAEDHNTADSSQDTVPASSTSLRQNPNMTHSEADAMPSCQTSVAPFTQPAPPFEGQPPSRKRRYLAEEPPDPESLILESQREADNRQEEEEEHQREISDLFWADLEPAARPGNPNTNAVAAWNKIRDKMKPPKCKGHNEDCVIRQVKKKGKNHGGFSF